MKILLITLGIIAIDIGCEVGFILWLRPLYARGNEWPALIFGIIASVLLVVGLLPPYFELSKRNGRVVDSLGAYFSIASVVVGELDILGIVLYAIIGVLEFGIFVSHYIWCCRFKWFGKSEYNDEVDNHSEVHSVEHISNDLDYVKVGYKISKSNSSSEFKKGLVASLNRNIPDKEILIYGKEDNEKNKNISSIAIMNDNASMIRSIHGITVQKGS